MFLDRESLCRILWRKYTYFTFAQTMTEEDEKLHRFIQNHLMNMEGTCTEFLKNNEKGRIERSKVWLNDIW